MAMLPIKTITIYCIWAVLFGSIPFGFLIIKIAGIGDVRTYGSGNIGATNVMRTGGKSLGVITLLLDTTKGFLPVFLAKHVGHLESEVLTFVILCAVIGHMFTPWLKFRGGKGVATAMGAVLAYHPIILLPAMMTFLTTLIISEYVSLSSIMATLILFLTATGAFGKWSVLPKPIYFPTWLSVLNWTTLAIMVTAKHAANIKRIFYGTESKYRNTK
jgi:glycerol-3-phosphate acyltransferase PlsY